jgi:hypothetical protein
MTNQGCSSVAERKIQGDDHPKRISTGRRPLATSVFTVAVALRGADGAVGGVLAADVNFQRLLNR